MSEEFRVDGSFRDRAAVDSKVFLTTTWRVIVNHSRNDFLTHSTLTNDEHTEICRCHLESDIEHMVQSFAVTYDIVPLFDGLKF